MRATLLYLTNIQLAGLNIHHYTRFFPGMVGLSPIGYIIVPCNRSVAVLDTIHNFVITNFLAVSPCDLSLHFLL